MPKPKRRRRSRTTGHVSVHFSHIEDACDFADLLRWAKRNWPRFPRDLTIIEGPGSDCRYEGGQIVRLKEGSD